MRDVVMFGIGFLVGFDLVIFVWIWRTDRKLQQMRRQP